MSFTRRPAKLHDCQRHGADSGSELLIVEGDSAAQAVWAVCNQEHQAVLPMQGKPVNAHKARPRAIESNELFRELTNALGFEMGQAIDPAQRRFQRIVLLFDPDAGGIHCGALMLIFFHRLLKPLLASGHLYLVRAPLFRFEVRSGTRTTEAVDPAAPEAAAPTGSRVLYAYTDREAQILAHELRAERFDFERQHFRGLASLGNALLRSTCVDPKTRQLLRLGEQDAQAAIAVFGGPNL